jgi:predicted amidohydrolase
MISVAAVQFDPKISSTRENTRRIVDLIERAVDSGVKLAVFPEAAVSGYVFESREDAMESAESIPGPSSDAIATECARNGAHVVFGLLEKEQDALFNAALFCGPNGIIGHYRKTHLPHLGVDRFCSRGDLPLRVFDSPVGRVGIMICYDQRFPEVARCLALSEAEIIALPTNWPRGAESAPDFILRTRALENRVFVVGANRVGHERGTEFIGRSCIFDPSANRLAEADGFSEIILRADIDPALAREKRLIIEKDKFEMDTVGDRRPDLYGQLVK